MDELLNFDEEESPSLKRPRETLESRFDHSSKKQAYEDEGELPEMDIEEPNQQSVLSEESVPIDRNLMNEYEKMNPVLAPKAVSMDDDEIMELLNRELPEEKTETKTQDVSDADLIAALDEFDEANTSKEKSITSSVQPPTTFTSTQFNKEMEESIEQVLAAVEQDSNLRDLVTNNTPLTQSTSSNSASLLQTTEGVSSLQFYLIDIYEDVNTSPGMLYLFGRVATGNSYESVCVIIQNIPHHLYFLPAISPSGERYSVAEVKEEILNTMLHIVKSASELAFRIDRKKYAFEIEGIPTEEVSDFIGLSEI